jgi:hypothetical protein
MNRIKMVSDKLFCKVIFQSISLQKVESPKYLFGKKKKGSANPVTGRGGP